MTLAVLCFFGSIKLYAQDAKSKIDEIHPNNANFIQGILEIICRRTSAFYDDGHINVQKANDRYNFAYLLSAVSKSDDSKNPFKTDMLELLNNLQFITVEYQNSYYASKKRVDALIKNAINAPEFLSTFFYSFLFCVLVFIFDCFGGTCQWSVNAVCWISIISTLYWVMIWIYYWCTISSRDNKQRDIVYVFKFSTCSIVLVLSLVISLGSVCWLGNSIYVPIVIALVVLLIGLFAMIKFRKRKYSIFSHYFNLIHIGIVVIYSCALCAAIPFICETDNIFVFNGAWAKYLVISCALMTGLIFPLAIPIIRVRREVAKAISEFKSATTNYLKEREKKIRELNELFNQFVIIRFMPSKENKSSFGDYWL